MEYLPLLLQDLTLYADIGFRVLYINHESDIRDEAKEGFSSHNSMNIHLSPKIKHVTCSSLSKIDRSFMQKEENIFRYRYDVIGIDECQFFSDLVQVVKIWLNEKRIIRCAGLDGDVFMHPFGDILQLIPLSDFTIKLNAKCHDCLKEDPVRGIVDAPFTWRIGKYKEQKVIGGKDIYLPVCRYHHDFHLEESIEESIKDTLKGISH